VSKKYREASRKVAGILTGAPPNSATEKIALVDDIIRGQAGMKSLEKDAAGANIGKRAFGDRWHGADSDWAALEAIGRWEREGRETQNLLAGFRQMAAAASNLDELLATVTDVRANLKPMLTALADAVAPLKLEPAAALGAASEFAKCDARGDRLALGELER
jgi:hypothetical protein